jgi:hypothetical protein
MLWLLISLSWSITGKWSSMSRVWTSKVWALASKMAVRVKSIWYQAESYGDATIKAAMHHFAPRTKHTLYLPKHKRSLGLFHSWILGGEAWYLERKWHALKSSFLGYVFAPSAFMKDDTPKEIRTQRQVFYCEKWTIVFYYSISW